MWNKANMINLMYKNSSHTETGCIIVSDLHYSVGFLKRRERLSQNGNFRVTELGESSTHAKLSFSFSFPWDKLTMGWGAPWDESGLHQPHLSCRGTLKPGITWPYWPFLSPPVLHPLHTHFPSSTFFGTSPRQLLSLINTRKHESTCCVWNSNPTQKVSSINILYFNIILKFLIIHSYNCLV